MPAGVGGCRGVRVDAGIEHPGIVPVYGLGTYDDGRPFYAMRFIHGDSLKEAIQAHHADDSTLDSTASNLRLRQMLGRFVDVCDAVARRTAGTSCTAT